MANALTIAARPNAAGFGPLALTLLLLIGLLTPAWAWPPQGKLKPEDDVSLIGHRKVGSGIDFYSQQKEIELGRGLAAEVEQRAKVIDDPVINEYINRLAQNLARNSDAKVAFTVRVLQDDSVNAFALPGGYFFVNSGLILAMNEEDELAGAMAHEIGHVAARHATRNATKGELLQLATLPVMIAVPGGLGGEIATQEAANILLPAQFMRFSRSAEREADWLGVQYLWKAGYDPNGLVRSFAALESLQKEKPGVISRAFESHPQTVDRLQTSEREIATILPPRMEYVVTTSEFNRIKQRLNDLLKKSVEKGVQVTPSPPPPPVINNTPASDEPPVLKPGQP